MPRCARYHRRPAWPHQVRRKSGGGRRRWELVGELDRCARAVAKVVMMMVVVMMILVIGMDVRKGGMMRG